MIWMLLLLLVGCGGSSTPQLTCANNATGSQSCFVNSPTANAPCSSASQGNQNTAGGTQTGDVPGCQNASNNPSNFENPNNAQTTTTTTTNNPPAKVVSAAHVLGFE